MARDAKKDEQKVAETPNSSKNKRKWKGAQVTTTPVSSSFTASRNEGANDAEGAEANRQAEASSRNEGASDAEGAEANKPAEAEAAAEIAGTPRTVEAAEKNVDVEAVSTPAAQAQGGQGSGRTRWTHQSKMLVFKWIAARNPFAALRGKTTEAWAAIADECRKSTSHLSYEQGKIDLSGHDIQVWIGKQLKPETKYASWKKMLAQEASTSGQTGLLSDHETKEFNLLAQIDDMKGMVQTEKDAMSEAKKKSEMVKNCQMNDEIYQWAMASEVQRPQALRSLNKKRKEIQIKMNTMKELGTRTKEEQLAQLSEADRNVLKYWDKCREQRPETSTGGDDYDSDENGNRSGRKRRTLEDSMNAISRMGSSIAQLAATPTATEKALERYLEYKISGGAATKSVQEGTEELCASVGKDAKAQLKHRLQFLEDAYVEGIITKLEHDEQRQAIIQQHFQK
jgi:hypothetical protein